MEYKCISFWKMLPSFSVFMCGRAEERCKRRLCTEWSGKVAVIMEACFCLFDYVIKKRENEC
jgi:hypothetical protein